MDHIGRYQVVRELGRGAMGVVYLATDPTIGRQVAIKTIRLNDVTDPDERAKLRERLFREARAAGSLSHPGIVTIYDMAEQDGLAYIAMEFVDGPTLDRLLSEKKALPPDRMTAILRQTAAALDYAHQKSIVHRDIKPANIMLDRAGAVKITDFGIAKVTTAQQFTQTGTIVGTPNYMSPEQVQGLAVDGRADQFSLAVIAFEMLTGERPFAGEHLTTVVYKIVAEEPVPPLRINPTLGPKIDAVLRKGLAKKPEARYLSCVELVSALESACAATAGWQNLPRGGSLSLPTVFSAPASGTSTTAGIRAHPPKSSKALPVLAAVLVALGLIGLLSMQVGGFDFAQLWPFGSSSAAGESPKQTSPAPLMQEKKAEERKPEQQPKPTAERAPLDAADSTPADSGATASQLPAPNPAEPKQPPIAEPQRPAFKPQEVSVRTEPPGATAMLDNSPETSCQTPCVLQAAPGRHSVSVTLAGFQHERREIQVGGSPVDLPAMNMRVSGGILMLSSAPPGAAVFVNDRRTSQTTPARLNLPPGTYNIAVEKDGKRKSESVEITNDGTRYLRIPLE